MAKTDDGSVPMTLQFPGDIYYYLKRIADLDRRSMNQEVFFLIEQAAKKMKVSLDMNNENVKKHLIANAPFEKWSGAGPKVEEEIAVQEAAGQQAARKEPQKGDKNKKDGAEAIILINRIRAKAGDLHWGKDILSKFGHTGSGPFSGDNGTGLLKAVKAAAKTTGINANELLDDKKAAGA